jgi:hypothetical protein
MTRPSARHDSDRPQKPDVIDAPRDEQRDEPRRTHPLARVNGQATDIQDIAHRLALAKQHAHLLASASTAAPPVGCAIAFNIVRVDVKEDCYSVGGGKFGIGGAALMKIAAAMRISWDGNASRRIDGGRDPRVCAYRAVGFYRSLDGQVVSCTGEVEIDMRDGSDQVEAMRKRARSEQGFDSQLRDTRLFLVRHAETKAKLRAIRQAAGIRGYTEEELRLPFVVPSLVFTGHSDDPVVRQALAIEIGKQMLGAQVALFGGAPSTPALPPAPADDVPDDFDDFDHGYADESEAYR